MRWLALLSALNFPSSPLISAVLPLSAGSISDNLPDPVLEGTNLVISCITSGGGSAAVLLLRNGRDSGVSGVTQQSNISVRVFDLGAVDRSNSGIMFQCVSGFDNSMSAVVTLDVQCE